MNTKTFPEVSAEICAGCGACINSCPWDAIAIQNGVAVINTSVCKGCMACQAACPLEAIQ